MGEFTIGDQTYTIYDTYAPGHAINEFEAKALNEVRTRAIAAAWGQRTRQSAKRGAEFDSSQSALETYASSYVLGNMPKGPGGKGAKDPYTAEAKKLATEKLRAHIKSQGAKVADVPNFDELVAQLAAREDVIEQAKARVEAAKALGDLPAIEIAPAASGLPDPEAPLPAMEPGEQIPFGNEQTSAPKRRRG